MFTLFLERLAVVNCIGVNFSFEKLSVGVKFSGLVMGVMDETGVSGRVVKLSGLGLRETAI